MVLLFCTTGVKRFCNKNTFFQDLLLKKSLTNIQDQIVKLGIKQRGIKSSCNNIRNGSSYHTSPRRDYNAGMSIKILCKLGCPKPVKFSISLKTHDIFKLML